VVAKFIFFFALIVSTSAWADLSRQLMTIAYQHTGHKQLEEHPFITSLETGEFTERQIVQYFIDKAYILKEMEKYLSDQDVLLHGTNFHSLPPDKKIFFRSHSYLKEVRATGGLFEDEGLPLSIPPSHEIVEYKNYLKGRPLDVVYVHIWLFLVGETFGARSIGAKINNKFPLLGLTAAHFEDLDLKDVRVHYNNWIKSKLQNPNVDFQTEIGIGYNYMIQVFNSAKTAGTTSSCPLL
jgi:hypothetical protein